MKEQLAELIEAYASAKTTNNKTLVEFSIGQLSAFFQKIEITEAKPPDDPPKSE